MVSTGIDTTTVAPQPPISEYRLLDQHKTNVHSAHSGHRTRLRKSLICDGAVSKNRKHPNQTLYYASDTTESSLDTSPPAPNHKHLNVTLHLSKKIISVGGSIMGMECHLCTVVHKKQARQKNINPTVIGAVESH